MALASPSAVILQFEFRLWILVSERHGVSALPSHQAAGLCKLLELEGSSHWIRVWPFERKRIISLNDPQMNLRFMKIDPFCLFVCFNKMKIGAVF